MTLLWMDGFELQDLATRYPSYYGGAYVYEPGRFGYGSSFITKDGGNVAQSVTPSSTLIVGCAMINWQSGNGGWLSVYGDGGTVEHVRLSMDSTGHVVVSRAGVVLGTSTAAPLPVSTTIWGYIEMKVVISDTVGSVEVRANGDPTPILNLTGQDTRNGGTSTNMDMVKLYASNGNWSGWDDLYVCNTSGTVNNDFLGDVRVYTLSPTGAGSSTQFTPLGGANYTNVDEQPYNTTDYVSSSNIGDIDLYAMADVPAGTILGAQTVFIAQKSDAGLGQLRSVLRSGATNYFGATKVLASGWLTYQDTIREVDPATSAVWTLSGINAIEAGAQVQ